tara:strand:- start:7 stop:297 length:291 start_codon:yes stop_codon:yes gene_type:complete
MFGLKKLFIIFFVSITLVSNKVEAFNLFELSLIGIGAGFVADQYFDSSMNRSNNYELKMQVVEKYLDSKVKKVSPTYFNKMPIQQQLLLIEEMENF